MSQETPHSDTTSADDSAAAQQAAKARKKKYKKSLNLPRTSFPMRANLAQNEPQSRRRWEKAQVFEQLIEGAKERPPFVFHDGPPYANGSIHVGHLLNKVLKDIVVRSRNMAGQFCHYVPGWDCHGLPIEHKVMTELVESGKMQKLASLEDDTRRMAIRRECSRYASKYKNVQAEQMKRLMTQADYDNPYMTMNPAYEQATLEVFVALLEQGLVYRALKPVHWSIANRTALAEAELEYQERSDPSIYVDFEVESPADLARAFGTAFEGSASLMIWTTTPWTLPANLMIAVHESFDYQLLEIGTGDDLRRTVVAKELVKTVFAHEGVESWEVLATCKGKDLLGITYRHPFCQRSGRVVSADYVTLEDGTGLVHTAPGHGQEDYATGLKEGADIYCPVQGDGTYDDSVPEWLRGLLIWDANPLIVEHLRGSGHLFHAHDFDHSYPHDWRSKTPVIFRSTEQWFVAVDQATRRDNRSLRQLALEANDDKVRFVPDWGRNRMRGMLESRPDWCLSRQRSWGLPIPAFRTADGATLLTAATVRAVAEVFGREGSDAWFSREPAHLLANYDPQADPEAPDGLDLAALEKMYDIFDVWFESGSSWNSVMRRRGLGYPVDLYLEGSDQHRGWFQLSLLPALGATGEPPFKTVLTHGFMVDKNGRKMSKSLGNALQVDDLLADHGADVCRWWVSSLAFENDIKVDPTFFDLAGDSYRKVRNTLRFLLSNLDDFDIDTAVAPADLEPTSLDAWVLQQAAELRQNVIAAYEGFQFRQAHLQLFDFCNETLSAVYLDAVKDRLYCDRPDSPRRRATQSVLWHLTEMLSALLAPILPHTADEAYRTLTGNNEDCVHLTTFPTLDVKADGAWPQVMALREQVGKALEDAKASGLENPLDAGLELADDDGLLSRFAADLADLLGVSRVSLGEGDGIIVQDLRQEPRCERSWRRDGTVEQRADGGYLSARDAEAVGI